MDNNLYCIIEISGGLGKNIIATTLVRSIKKTYPNYKIIIITGWCEPFYNNINVYKLFHFNEARYIFDDYVNENTKIFALEVYKSQNYVLRKKHLSECWTSLYSDLIYDGNKPDIILNPRELEIAKDKFKPNDKKVFAIQMNGGSDAGNGGQYSKKSWARDIPIEQAQKIVNHFHSKNYRVIQIMKNDQLKLLNTEQVTLPLRELFSIFSLTNIRLLIDSFPQHLCAALNLPSTVLWIQTSSDVFGYDIHKNINPNVEPNDMMNKFSYLDKYDFSGSNINEFPYNTLNIFNIDEIINSLEEQAKIY